MSDVQWMQRALLLARRGEGYVEPNPMVGAVIVRNDEIMGEGWHQRFGDAHAELNALRSAGDRSRGATMYVTLEPCCHHGKTPPCTEAVIREGLTRVVIAMADPFPQVAGRGVARLREAGIRVEIGLLEPEARRLNAPYLTLVERNRPFVHAKWAMTLDGKIASRTGHSRWISGDESRARVHQLRGRMDAIIIGAGTLRADDPLLTARPPGPRTALRVVLSRDGELPQSCRLLQSARENPVLVAGAGISSIQSQRLCELGVEVFPIGAIVDLMNEFGRRQFTNVLVEGGASALGSFRDAGLIDMVHVFISPVLVGGEGATTAIAGAGAATIGEALRLVDWQCERLGNDYYLSGLAT